MVALYFTRLPRILVACSVTILLSIFIERACADALSSCAEALEVRLTKAIKAAVNHARVACDCALFSYFPILNNTGNVFLTKD